MDPNVCERSSRINAKIPKVRILKLPFICGTIYATIESDFIRLSITDPQSSSSRTGQTNTSLITSPHNQGKINVVPASQLREAQGRIRELERALGRKTMEVEILQMAQEEVKKRPSFYGVSVRK